MKTYIILVNDLWYCEKEDKKRAFFSSGRKSDALRLQGSQNIATRVEKLLRGFKPRRIEIIAE